MKKKENDEIKDRVLPVRFASDDLEKLRREARKLRITVSALVRMRAMKVRDEGNENELR